MSDLAQNHVAERAELEAVLSSGIFVRAPSLAHMLSYVCEKHFQGQAEELKEYNIAVEALQRPPDFDQKKDSIVRVEAHRLRKRLRSYYQTDGAAHDIHIDLPTGGYAPSFIHRASGGETDAQTAASQPGPPRLVPRPMLAAAAALLVCVMAVFGMWRWRAAASGLAPASDALVARADSPQVPAESISEVRILCGSADTLVDADGRHWVPDRYFTGGTAATDEIGEVLGSLDTALFRHARTGAFTYRIPVKEGVYEVSLYFSEPRYATGAQGAGNETARLFDVLINGQAVLTEMDIFAEAGGGRTMVRRVFRDIEPDAEGMIAIDFRDRVGGALVNGISVVPGVPRQLRPIRVAARASAYTDSSGRFWSSDRYFTGGKLVMRQEAVHDTSDPDLYRGERFGNFSYSVTVAPGSTYTAVLHFAETWFGGGVQGQAGARLFDVFCNGSRLLQNFDVYREAGGPFRAIQRTFKGLKPTPSGRLLFQFNPSRNYAFVNAIEIIDEGRAAPAQSSRLRTP